MSKIHILDEHIANQIAAGEVVERPASVIKELVENAIDAGSTRIDVAVEEGGLQLIRVTDNGAGIDGDDCETAFYRHATSKIANGRDLFQIRSLGFRGEALPSIAAVSKVECISSAEDTGLGRRIVIEGGSLKTNADTNTSRGTDFTVRELFYNTPARLKYMKTIQTELGHISDTMHRMALAHPQIAFTLRHNGNTLLQTLGNGDLLQVIAAIYGTSIAKSMIPIEGEQLDYSVKGYVCKPEQTRSNRNAISTVVNGRFIRNYALNQAVQQAYHTLLPINRFPLVVLHLEMHPSLVDVNVHPAKLEVRFSKELELCQFVQHTIAEVLQDQVLIPAAAKPKSGEKNGYIQEQLQFNRAAASAPVDGSPVPDQISGRSPERYTWNPPTLHEGRTSAFTPLEQQKSNEVYADRRAGAGFEASTVRERERVDYAAGSRPNGNQQVPYRPTAPMSPDTIQHIYQAPEERVDLPAFPELSMIGQMHGTYLIAQNDTGLYLIDQHAAHERINYEFYYEKFGNPADASQELLLPITLEFTPTETEVMKTKLPLFEQAGVILEHFGGQSFIIRAYPHWFPEGDETALVQEMAEWILQEKSVDIAKLREKSAIMCSCKASIKANQKLTTLEAEVLIERLAACKQPYTCPHGRPIVVSFSTYELEKMFKRVM
ncbi:DNA mismatch repair protein MutL [Paenibacillus selenitireducens]|uniref:DNA mismatch repair protein MutL n=1 Tax=Paenibacillus selenitireducens TaxID=1324314 RepID=A0A1T2X4C5_9BACL|nr:DNA mismatch repair endonuclease MutL [Paenibacillus selenitireducens]OPA74700.1 DNA mismatch repair protein MutL [Paenibacillus selenitireducens]